MSIGRGQLFRSFREGLLRISPCTEDGGPKCRENSGLTGISPGFDCAGPAAFTRNKWKKKAVKVWRYTGHAVTPPACLHNPMDRMPPEILLKILSHLDALSLFSIGLVNKQFYEMTHNNGLWHKIYFAQFGQSKTWMTKHEDEQVLEKLTALVVREQPEGHWRRLYFRTVAGYSDRWRQELRDINPFTGLPSQTERLLRSQRVTWEITVCDKRGYEATFRQSRTFFSDSSVTVCWNNGLWPTFNRLSGFQLDCVKGEPLGSLNANKTGWRSLMAKFDTDAISKSGQVIGRDQLVTLILLSPGVILGVWRGRWSVAFVMAGFHHHRLLERCLLGTAVCPYSVPEDKPPFDDADPHYGLHGYTLRVVLHNTVSQMMAGHFPQLYCCRGLVHGGFIQLNVIDRENESQHSPFSGRISLPWRWEALEGAVENCCMMNLTLMDEYHNPFWCVSTPVSMVMNMKEPSNYEGQHFIIKYQDAEGKMRMELVWMEEQKQYFLISLVVFIATAIVNKHFAKSY
ncbi:hypothetical protein DPEC_G00323900 [Dallia pectoralis]|uniref:Uncharacterized protein n=1 Tax=Dallia pectoralis TaxID=75939 RepID=A0ACC2FB45_DALPE|nr:hypothetical protein DPEC_G00323900 [Dallia pectoralis]